VKARSIIRLEDITLVKFDLIPFQKRQILPLKRPLPMALGLITDILNHAPEIGLRDAERSVAFLPAKAATEPPLFVDVVGTPAFDFADYLRKPACRIIAEQNVGVIRHAVDGDELLLQRRGDAGHVALQFFAVLFADAAHPPVYGENDVEINLRVRVGHGFSHAAPTELWVVGREIYKHVAPTALERSLGAATKAERTDGAAIT